MRSKMKQVATTTLSGAAALQSNDIGHCRAVARGRTEIATKELTSIKRTARGEAEAEATAERVK
jgi:hypothetical protein